MNRLAKIRHWKCGEPAGITYVWIPGEWTRAEFAAAVDRARGSYIKALEFIKGSNEPPNDYRRLAQPLYRLYPDKTVAEIDAEWEQKRIVWEAWQARDDQTRRRFEDFLADEGLELLGATDDESDAVTCDWGHHHGLGIEWPETQTDTFLTPAQFAEEQR